MQNPNSGGRGGYYPSREENVEENERGGLSAPAAPRERTGARAPAAPRLGQSYVPYQRYEKILPPSDALRRGTVFAELVL